MAYIIRENKAEPIKQYSVYVIFSPYEKKFFIGKCAKNQLRATYKEHYILRNRKTKEVFEKSKQSDLRPPMYLLETVECSRRRIFNHCVAWTKYFLQHGYEPFVNDILRDYSEDPNEKVETIFNVIKDYNINEICSPGKDLFPNYAKKKKGNIENTVPPSIHFFVQPEEYKKLETEAKKNNMNLSAYCRLGALGTKFYKIDFSFMNQYLAALETNISLMRQIEYIIQSQGNYTLADLSNLEILVKSIEKIHDDALTELDNFLKRIKDINSNEKQNLNEES